MKTLQNILILIIFFSVKAFSTVPIKNKLPSGWYLVTDSKVFNSIKLENSAKTYRIEKKVFISVKNITDMDIITERYANKNNPVLNFTLDKTAATKLGTLPYNFEKDKQIALVIDNKLIQVATIHGKFSGNKMSFASSYTKEELLKLKKLIEIEKSL